MASVTQFGYTGARVTDLAAWETFATEILGLELSERLHDGTILLRMDENHFRIALHPGSDDDVAYMGWQVTDERALAAIADQVQAYGITVDQGSEALADTRQVRGLIAFRDPSGIATEIFYGPRVDANRPFQSLRPISGFVTGEQGLGHAVLRVDDQDESLHFYRDILGMRVTDFIRSMVFLHCNPRHHSLALMTAEQPKRLWHWMLQVNSLDDVGSTYDLCEQRGIAIAGRMGRHTNDRMVSFYVITPSGFEIEYGWGARVVDDATWQVQRHVTGTLWGHQRVRPATEALQPAAVLG
jgi:biphenyl-2,3-diol 1,2-dioxygenase